MTKELMLTALIRRRPADSVRGRGSENFDVTVFIFELCLKS